MDSRIEERALTIMVPEAEAFVQSFRAQYDSLAQDNIPAHITINIPFSPATAAGPQLEAILLDLFASVKRFQFELTEIRRFPTALYLAVEPEERFRALISAVAARFPESPPYEGRFADVIPHLTVAYLEDPQEIDAMNNTLSPMLAGALPISGKVTNAQLLEKIDGRWRESASFPLAP